MVNVWVPKVNFSLAEPRAAWRNILATNVSVHTGQRETGQKFFAISEQAFRVLDGQIPPTRSKSKPCG
jgi:hypothetical protein